MPTNVTPILIPRITPSGHSRIGRAALPAATTDRKPLFGEAPQKPGLASLLRRVVLLGAMLFPVGGSGLAASQKALAESPSDSQAFLQLPKEEPELVVLKPGPISESSGWGPNVKVLAACSEQFAAKADDSGGCYTQSLLQVSGQSGIGGFEEAHDLLEQTGYQLIDGGIKAEKSLLFHYYPLSTPGKKDLWLKKEQKERYAILASQIKPILPANKKELAKIYLTSLYNNSFRAGLNAVEEFLYKPGLYHLPTDRIQRLNNVTEADLEKAVANLSEKFRENPDAELLIYYLGHGIRRPNPAGRDREGDGIGLILEEAAISEERVKQWLKEFLPPEARVLIIIDACHSGAWIAKNEQSKAVKALS